MRVAKFAAIVMLWIACGVAGMGGLVADQLAIHGPCRTDGLRPSTNYREEMGFAGMLAPTGPLILFVSLGATGFWEHGWSLKPPVCAEEEQRAISAPCVETYENGYTLCSTK
jgi:hypothetical protein